MRAKLGAGKARWAPCTGCWPHTGQHFSLLSYGSSLGIPLLTIFPSDLRHQNPPCEEEPGFLAFRTGT